MLCSHFQITTAAVDGIRVLGVGKDPVQTAILCNQMEIASGPSGLIELNSAM